MTMVVEEEVLRSVEVRKRLGSQNRLVPKWK